MSFSILDVRFSVISEGKLPSFFLERTCSLVLYFGLDELMFGGLFINISAICDSEWRGTVGCRI